MWHIVYKWVSVATTFIKTETFNAEMAPTLYMTHASPPVRAVLMTAKAIGLELNEKDVDFEGGEHLTPEYLKMNPQHTFPLLVDDNGFTIWDSHAIMTYLVSKYAKDDSLYPKDLEKRAVVDQRLHFESGIIFSKLLRITKPIVFYGRKVIYDEDKESMVEGYEFLEEFLEGKKWAAGDFVSVADYSLVASVGSIGALVPIDPEKFPNITAWLKRVAELPEYEANKRGQQEFEALFKSRLSEA